MPRLRKTYENRLCFADWIRGWNITVVRAGWLSCSGIGARDQRSDTVYRQSKESAGPFAKESAAYHIEVSWAGCHVNSEAAPHTRSGTFKTSSVFRSQFHPGRETPASRQA